MDRSLTPDAKHTLERGCVLSTGAQVLTRLLLLRQERGATARPDMRGFISGYRGSPPGGLGQALLDHN
jgi:indolepyruvate ferredoxin oxidoreductase